MSPAASTSAPSSAPAAGGSDGSFLALSVATANADPGSICAVGLVHFKGGRIGQQLKFLVNPQSRFETVNIGLHGIRPEHVAQAPVFKQIHPALAAAFATTMVVHHSYFDRFALARAADKHKLAAPECTWLDSAFVVRQTWPRFAKRGFALKNLAREFGIELIHRDPCEDARVTGLILLKALAENGLGLRDLIGRFAEHAQRHTGVLRAVHAKIAQRASPWVVIGAPRVAGAAGKGNNPIR